MIRHRGYATVSRPLLETCRQSCRKQLHQFDKSSYVLAAYVPSPARDCFMALKWFNLEVAKIQGNEYLESRGLSSAELKIKYWEETLHKVFYSDTVVKEPVGILLQEALAQGLNLDMSYFQQILQSKRMMGRHQIRSTDDLCSLGEGIYSQLNYLVQNLLLSEHISPSTLALLEEDEELRDLLAEIMAHLGQSYGVASTVLRTEYYAKHQNSVLLPLDLMTQADLSQEDVLRLFQGHMENPEAVQSKLKDVVYNTCIVANDHLLTARHKYHKVQEIVQRIKRSTTNQLILQRSKSWKRGIPDCLFVPLMTSIPLGGYLQILEKNGFDVVNKKMENPYWKLIWWSFLSYQTRKI